IDTGCPKAHVLATIRWLAGCSCCWHGSRACTQKHPACNESWQIADKVGAGACQCELRRRCGRARRSHEIYCCPVEDALNIPDLGIENFGIDVARMEDGEMRLIFIDEIEQPQKQQGFFGVSSLVIDSSHYRTLREGVGDALETAGWNL